MKYTGAAARHSSIAAVALALFPAAAAAQGEPYQGQPTEFTEPSLALTVGSVVVVAVIATVCAALLIHLAAEWTQRANSIVLTEPAKTGGVGFLALLVLFVLTLIVSVVTLGLGMLLMLPVFMLVVLLGGVVGYIALGYVLLDRVGDGTLGVPGTTTLWKCFGAGYVAMIAIGLPSTIVMQLGMFELGLLLSAPGNLIGLVLASLGVGAIVQNYRKDPGSPGGEQTSRSGVSESW